MGILEAIFGKRKTETKCYAKCKHAKDKICTQTDRVLDKNGECLDNEEK